MTSTAWAILFGLPFGVGTGFVLGYTWVHWEEHKRAEEDAKQASANEPPEFP